jgi:hypothetical protein
MKKYIPLYLFLPMLLNSMNAPKPLACTPLTINHWQFFSENNDLDRMPPAKPFWNSKKKLPIETIAHLHVLENSNLGKKDSIFNPQCGSGDVAYFLAPKADQVVACTGDKDDMVKAIEKCKHPNLTFSYYFANGRYDLIVSCHPIADSDSLAKLKCLLNPRGEIFCLFNTQSNKKSVFHQAFENMNPLLQKRLPYFQYNIICSALKEMFPRPADDLLQGLIAESSLEVLTYKQNSFDILIAKDQHKKFIAGCKALFMTLPRSFESQACIEKKMNKLANFFVENILKIITKDDSGNWFYPFDCTIVHLKAQ